MTAATELLHAPAGRLSWLRGSRRDASVTAMLLFPAVLLAAAVLLWPVAAILVRAVSEPSWGLQNFAQIVATPGYLMVIRNTLLIGALVTAICIVVSFPLAYTIATTSERSRRLLIFFVLIPFWTSGLVRTFAWMVLLQRTGVINEMMVTVGIINEPITLIYNRAGVLIGMTHVFLPFMIMTMWAAMSKIDPNLMKAGSSLGAAPVRNFLRIYLPLSMPGVIGGSILVFTMSLGAFMTPALMGGMSDVMVAQLIEQQIGVHGQWGLAGALSLILIAVTLAGFALMPSRLLPEAPR